MKKTDISFLVSLLERAGHWYHNEGKFLPLDSKTLEQLHESISAPVIFGNLKVMTDAFYDFLEEALKKADPKNPFLKQVGAPVTSTKVKLSIQMSGLEKITVNNGSVDAFTSSVQGPYLLSHKLDGISIQVVYDDNFKVKSAYTRGDGIYSEDITPLIPYLRIPQKSPYKNIRGEIIMRQDVFDKKWAEEYENPRNLVGGKVNSKKFHPSLADMDVIFYGVLSDSSEKPSAQLKKLKDAGFDVVVHSVVKTTDEVTLSEALKVAKAASSYALDGIVVVADRVGLKHSVDSPEWGRKFKENVDFYEVTVTGVSFEPSKDGYLKPTLIIEPTRMSGVTVTNTTAFNYKFIVENKLGIGAKILITRSGDVIPHIVEVLEQASEVFVPDEDWVWNDTGVDAMVLDPDNHPIVQLRRIAFFFRTLEIDELGESTFEKAVAAGFDSIDKIIKMSQEDWKSIDGFAGRRGEICFTEMRKCLDNVYLPSLADASGFFGRGFGTTRFETMLAAHPDLMQLNLRKAEWFEKAIVVKGIGEVTADQFATGISQFVNWLDSLKDYITLVEPEKTEVLGAVFKDQGVTFTGFRNADWQTIVEQQGGSMVDFGGKTTMLVYGGKKSSKVDKALAKGIKTYSQGEFMEFMEANKLM